MRPTGTSAASSAVIVMQQSIHVVAFLERRAPRLARALGEQSLQLLLWNLVVPPVERAVVVEDLPARQQKLRIEVSTLQGYDEEIQECFQKASTGFEILYGKKVG